MDIGLNDATASKMSYYLRYTSEVRSDGKEVFVQQGWLRASHRKEDPALSTALRPYQTHLATDAQPLSLETAGIDADSHRPSVTEA